MKVNLQSRQNFLSRRRSGGGQCHYNLLITSIFLTPDANGICREGVIVTVLRVLPTRRFMTKSRLKCFQRACTRECWQVLLSYLVYSFLDIWAFTSTITTLVYPPYLTVTLPQTLSGRLAKKYFSDSPAIPY